MAPKWEGDPSALPTLLRHRRRALGSLGAGLWRQEPRCAGRRLSREPKQNRGRRGILGPRRSGSRTGRPARGDAGRQGCAFPEKRRFSFSSEPEWAGRKRSPGCQLRTVELGAKGGRREATSPAARRRQPRRNQGRDGGDALGNAAFPRDGAGDIASCMRPAAVPSRRGGRQRDNSSHPRGGPANRRQANGGRIAEGAPADASTW